MSSTFENGKSILRPNRLFSALVAPASAVSHSWPRPGPSSFWGIYHLPGEGDTVRGGGPQPQTSQKKILA